MMDQQASIGPRQKQVFLQGLEPEPNPTFFRNAMKHGSERSAGAGLSAQKFVLIFCLSLVLSPSYVADVCMKEAFTNFND